MIGALVENQQQFNLIGQAGAHGTQGERVFDKMVKDTLGQF